MVSNALLRSTKHAYIREDDLKALSISVLSVKMWSVMRHYKGGLISAGGDIISKSFYGPLP